MSKLKTCVFPRVVPTGFLMMSLFFFGIPSGAFGQDGSPISEAERQARDALSKGVNDFKNGLYDEAIADFQRAKQLDPNMINARLYLATAYASQYIPGAPPEENRQKGEAALREFKEVLGIQPENLPAIDGAGSILFQMAGLPYDSEKFNESKLYHKKHIELRPDDPEPYYWVGVIDWTLSYRGNAELRASYSQTKRGRRLKDEDPFPADVREGYKREFGPAIEEGIENMKKAISLKPDYDDAMAYLNLLYRRKADTVAYQDERDELIKMADDLLDRVKDIKQKRAEQPPQQ